MQAPCPQCSQKVLVDDAKAPDRPFSVRCPKCQCIVRFPGRSPDSAAPAPAAPSAPPGDGLPEEVRAEMTARLRREVRELEAARGQVLAALADPQLAKTLTQPLADLGYVVDVLDIPEEGGRLLEQGTYSVVVTSRTAPVPGQGETLYARLCRLNPEVRRRIFVVLAGEEFRTGDGTQAFVTLADLVVNPKDAAAVEMPLLNAMAEWTRLFQAYRDARRRFEEAES